MSEAALPRSLLYVPGNAADKLARALDRGADALILDLEDAVPWAEKDTARAEVLEWLGSQGSSAPADIELWVRVNSGARRDSDVAALASAPCLTGLVLAKVTDAEDVRTAAEALADRGDHTTRLMPMIETARALLDARALAGADPRVHRLQVGEVDLAGELGLDPGADEGELAGVRTLVVVASTAAGLSPPVGPVSRITRDLDAFTQSTQRVRRQGFVGRACIHPIQVEVANRVFTPTRAEVTAASEVVDLVARTEAAGSGVVLDAEGRLVDAAVLHGARRVLAQAERGRVR